MAKKIKFEFVKELRDAAEMNTKMMVRAATKKHLNPEMLVPRVFEAIECGDGLHYVSVQASACHYCTPRKTLDKREYDEFEIALCYRGGDKDDNIPMQTAETFLGGKCELSEKLDRYMEKGEFTIIFPYVPGELVEELIETSRKIYGEKECK